jgi:hypothetical protein
LIVVRLVGRLLRSWRFQEGHLEMVIGLGDPARTGMATGLFYAVQPALRQRLPRFGISLIPDFHQPTMRVEGDLTLRLLPIEPLRHLVYSLGTLPWRGLWKLRKAWTT